ncbi:MAG: ergothioneine biosynthesis protein EgtB [Comamonadaceae bacterium]|nr:ergothioneine biosynthesis protein EgtB [Comamonadaceae bacterium]
MLNALLRNTRARTLALAAPLSDEDAQLQSMPEASPAKWHLAHTTWFFETLVLAPHLPGYRVFDERWPRLFNSYYESLGPRHARPQRGLLSRPSLAEIKAYRAHVDAALADLLPQAPAQARALIELGCQHEQQHQELLLTDLLHAFSCNPLLPAYDARPPAPARAPRQAWLPHAGGIVDVGHGGEGFAFDNEGPRHQVLLAPFEISNRLVTCGEYADFIEAGGYREPLLWLSDGWAAVQAQGWQRPAYWLENGRVFGLHGVQPLDADAPVMQLSFYEACAYAEWAGARLPTEFEWEAAASLPGFEQAATQAWQWTRSSYAPYPGFRPAAGAVGEYNGKFMVGQQVLRGGSLATPPGHARPSYRNFFPPAARWQFSGLRLAR